MYLAAVNAPLLPSLARGRCQGLRLALLAGLAAAIGCEPAATNRQTPTGAPAPPAAAPPLAPPVLPTAAQFGYRRYAGTVDGRPVLAEINLWQEENVYINEQWYPTPKFSGYFYYRATGATGTLGEAHTFPPAQTLETWHSGIVGRYYERLAVLCADQPPGGPLLSGWCRQPGQRRWLPVRLHESYADGVRYEILREESDTGDSRDDAPATGRVSREYLHLLGPDTLRPALARLQCPPPAARQRACRALLARIGEFNTDEESLDVTLNEAELLACTVFWIKESGPRYYIQSGYRRLFDLRTGRELRLLDQLRPGGRRQLQELLTRRALADTAYARHRDHWRHGPLLALPNEGFELTPQGWTACYGDPTPEDSYGYGRALTWAEVRPLLRPNSPLQRLLRVRGL